MRRLAFLVAGAALWFMFGPTPAVADAGPHVESAGDLAVADSCTTCHRLHTAKVGDLLKEAQPALCFTCHGSTGTGASTDVVTGRGYPLADRAGAVGALRGGGFASAMIDSANPSAQSNAYSNASGIIPVRLTSDHIAVTSTHSVDGTSLTTWGNGALGSGVGGSIALRCATCHDPHGNGNFRILRSSPTGSGGASTPNAEALAIPKLYTTANYWRVDDINTASYIANISAWCATCHTRYLAPSGSGSTDSTDAIYGFRHFSADITQGSPTCIQCHVAHGSNAAMGGTQSSAVTLPDGTSAASSSRLLRIDNRGTCQMCHLR